MLDAHFGIVKVVSGNSIACLMPLPTDANKSMKPELVLTVDIDFSPLGLRRRWFSSRCRYETLPTVESDNPDHPCLLRDLAPARTFTFVSVIDKLKEAGLIKGGKPH